ncbi:MAG TPA: redox-regulated ATPase YchF [Elusimicrobia bacterium]|nr:redox-regulated ATPase YchF [Elusimicrobiota bacterium]
MQIGIIGLPNVGKSTLFNSLTNAHAVVADYPFTTIEPNVGIVSVPDDRLKKLGDIYHPEKLTPTTIKFVDIAGLVKGASKGEGLGNKFLSHIREMDAIVQVVGCFRENSNPADEIEIIKTELFLADLEVVNRKISSVSPRAKCGIKEAKEELEILYKIKSEIETGKMSRLEVADIILLSSIPVIYVANVKNTTSDFGLLTSDLITINAKLEGELLELSDEEKKELGVKSELGKLILASYKLLDLITFYTTVGVEIRAWNIKKGTSAQKAAGKIHTDFEKNFIRAEVFNFSELEKYGTDKALHDKGLVRLEGRDYIVQDGDILRIKI